MQTFRLVDCKVFNVVVERKYPVQGGTAPDVFIANLEPLPWAEACRELQKQLAGNAVDANLVVVGPRRPWSVLTLSAYLRVLDGPEPATDLLKRLRAESAASREDLLLSLTGINNDMLGVAQEA